MYKCPQNLSVPLLLLSILFIALVEREPAVYSCIFKESAAKSNHTLNFYHDQIDPDCD